MACLTLVSDWSVTFTLKPSQMKDDTFMAASAIIKQIGYYFTTGLVHVYVTQNIDLPSSVQL